MKDRYAVNASRRRFLEAGGRALLGAGSMALLAKLLPAPAYAEQPPSDYRAAALRVARWLQACQIEAGSAIAWPAVPGTKESPTTDLYSGASGVVLFFLEAYHATGDAKFLHSARGGADFLLARLADEKATSSPGLYTGSAGVGFCLDQTFAVCRDGKYRLGAERCLRSIESEAKAAGAGVAWNDTHDIIAGSAGVGLFLLYAARQWNNRTSMDLAIKAGRRLIEVGTPEQGGLKWAMDAKFPRLMPNFSHGTAGICYFLATLYKATQEKAFLDAALAGTRYLQAVAATEHGGCLIFHHEPGGKDLYYLGWCHGPVGTARLFYQLHQVTGDAKWMDWVHRSARSLLESGIPEKQTPGFWNNAGQCCGLAGVADFFLSLHRITKNPEYLKFCERVTATLLARATPEKDGLKWVQAEHRVRPQDVAAQTGYMQGAAGIGMLLLRLDAFLHNKQPSITLLDSPF
jgi:lantibiotic modifying enzyme